MSWKMCMLSMVLCAAVALPGWANVVFQDGFESDAPGSAPTAEVGSWSISGGATVVADPVSGTGQCLKVVRPLGGSSPSVKGFAVSGVTYEAGYDVIIKADLYQGGWYHTAALMMEPSTGGGGFEAGVSTRRMPPSNYYRYVLPTGSPASWSYSYINTPVKTMYDQWVTYEIVMHLEAAATAGFCTGTYDLYVTPAAGGQITLAEDIPLRDIESAGTIRLGIWSDTPEDYTWGGDVITHWDNLSIEVVPEPATLGLLAVGLLGMKLRRRS